MSEESKMRIEWHKAHLADIISHYMKDVKLKDKADSLVNWESFVDPVKKIVTFEMFIERKP